MGDIIDNEEIDKDTLDPETLEQLFNKKYDLIAETNVSVKKSYINKITGTKSSKLAVSLQDHSIEVYELNNGSLSKTCRLSGHKKALKEVVFSPKDDHLLYSAGEDGLIKLWDTRQKGSCVLEYKDEESDIVRPYECMDVSCNSRVLCAGSQVVEDDAYLVFWDTRVTKPLGGYWESHTDDITQVKFHKEKTEIIATGSLDGLLNIFNVMEQSEDDALVYSLNVENSVERVSWLDGQQLACVAQSNDLQIWDTESGDLIRSFGRDKIARSLKRSKNDDCYLVDAYTSVDDLTVVLAGSYGGDGNVLRSLSLTNKKLQPSSNFAQNKQIVRCCWYHKDNDLLVTAGESGTISVWQGSAPGAAAPGKLHTSLSKLHVNRHKPY
ncbi:WD repeat-containing protein 89 [Plodia interpunctella]|uniref:WD repeat-containing protein 89 n=1 Tax=Plodia interpunctella TaxID=58824 RepID=UPI00236898B4|nr:WD repeat-containing protein 89 [Plodia interpunctella]